MDEKTIRDKMKAASDEFDGLESQRQDIVVRMNELRGEYKAYESMLEPATTVVAEQPEVKSAKR